MFAILLGEFFKVLSLNNAEEAIYKSHLIAYIFLGVGIIGGFSTFGSGWLLGTSGEKMATRLRLAVFKVRGFRFTHTCVAITFVRNFQIRTGIWTGFRS